MCDFRVEIDFLAFSDNFVRHLLKNCEIRIFAQLGHCLRGCVIFLTPHFRGSHQLTLKLNEVPNLMCELRGFWGRWIHLSHLKIHRKWPSLISSVQNLRSPSPFLITRVRLPVRPTAHRTVNIQLVSKCNRAWCPCFLAFSDYLALF